MGVKTSGDAHARPGAQSEWVVRRSGIADSISVDRKPTRETNIRMMAFLTQDTSGWRDRKASGRSEADDAGCVKDTSRKENVSRSGWSVGQDGQDVSG